MRNVNPPAPEQQAWFAEWMRKDRGFLPRGFSRTIVLPHPGAKETGRPGVPFAAPNPNDIELSEAQATALDDVLLELFNEQTPCTFARYGGFMSAAQCNQLTSSGYSRIDGRLTYFLGSGPLSLSLFTQAAETFDGFLPLSYLWPDSQDWCIASAPDLDFTAVGCADDLADQLLASPAFDTREWPGLPTS